MRVGGGGGGRGVSSGERERWEGEPSHSYAVSAGRITAILLIPYY